MKWGVVLARALIVLSGWWALFAWHPQDQPPAWALFGPFSTHEECLEYLQYNRLPPSFESIRCVELEDPAGETGREVRA